METYDFIYTVDPTASEPIILINDEIGVNSQTYQGISGAQFQKELLALDAMGKKRIKVYINSVGGSVLDGMSIFDAIIQSKASVDTYCVGVACSIAGVIFLAGKNRYIADYGLLMTHNPWMEGVDTYNEYLDRTRDSLITMISGRTGIDSKEIENIMDKETWMNADEAIESGFATDIIKSSDNNKKRVIKQTEAQDKQKECSEIMYKVFNLAKNTNKNMSLNKINAKLGLNEDASVENTMAEITKLLIIKNKVDSDEEDDDDDDDNDETLDKMKAELAASNAKYEDCYNELSKMKADMEEMEAKNKKKEAIDCVLGYVKMGKVRDEAVAIERWALAIEALGVENVKPMLEDLPVNRTATKIATQNSPNTAMNSNVSAVALKMAELNKKIK